MISRPRLNDRPLMARRLPMRICHGLVILRYVHIVKPRYPSRFINIDSCPVPPSMSYVSATPHGTLPVLCTAGMIYGASANAQPAVDSLLTIDPHHSNTPARTRTQAPILSSYKSECNLRDLADACHILEIPERCNLPANA